MQHANLKAEIRQIGPKSANREMRLSGQVPAILYGRKSNPLTIKLDPKPLKQLLHGGAGANTLIHLDIAGVSEKKERVVLLKEIQRHPVSNSWIHVDFFEIALDEAVTVKVPLHFEGKAKGIIDGGIVEIQIRQIEVSCLPTAIPDYIAVDISDLGIGDSLHVSDVKVPADVTVVDSPTLNLVSLVLPTKEEEVKPAEVAADAAAAGAAPAAGAPAAAGAAPAAGAPAAAAGKKPDAPAKK